MCVCYHMVAQFSSYWHSQSCAGSQPQHLFWMNLPVVLVPVVAVHNMQVEPLYQLPTQSIAFSPHKPTPTTHKPLLALVESLNSCACHQQLIMQLAQHRIHLTFTLHLPLLPLLPLLPVLPLQVPRVLLLLAFTCVVCLVVVLLVAPTALLAVLMPHTLTPTATLTFTTRCSVIRCVWGGGMCGNASER